MIFCVRSKLPPRRDSPDRQSEMEIYYQNLDDLGKEVGSRSS